jgi:hypothetical protein
VLRNVDISPRQLEKPADAWLYFLQAGRLAASPSQRCQRQRIRRRKFIGERDSPPLSLKSCRLCFQTTAGCTRYEPTMDTNSGFLERPLKWTVGGEEMGPRLLEPAVSPSGESMVGDDEALLRTRRRHA